MRTLLTLAISCLLFACGGSGDSSSDDTSVEQLRSTITQAASDSAINCGEVQVAAAPEEVDQCLIQAYNNQTPAYAIYFLQGIDSTVARGVVIDSDRTVRFWTYDSWGTGQITEHSCELPLSNRGQYFYAYLAVCLDRENPAYVSFDEFGGLVASDAGADATECGTAEAGDNLFNINQCIVDAFILQNPAYAIYKLQGIDSIPAYGITISGAGVVNQWSYDSNIFGGPGVAVSRVDSDECENPQPNANLEVAPSRLFTCQ